MPRRSKRSKAASARNIEKLESKIALSNDDIHNNQNKGLTRKSHIDLDDLKISYVSTIRGNFNQGDEQFSAHSRGVQCSCNALVMLCHIQTIINDIMPYNLDNILQDGDKLYKDCAKKLQDCGQLARNGYLYHDQLPTNVVIRNVRYKINYDELKYGTLDQHRESIFEPLHVELPKAFTVSQKNILILGGSMMALYKDITCGQYLFFDSHSRNESGFPDCDGTSFAIIFPDINNLVKYLQALATKMNLDSTNYAILPVMIISEQKSKSDIQLLHNQSEKNNTPCIAIPSTATVNKTNNLACRNQCSSQDFVAMKSHLETRTLRSISTIGSSGWTDEVNKLSDRRRMSRYEKWLADQSNLKKEDLLARKRKSSWDTYQNSDNAAKKCKQASDAYKDPKTAKRKCQQARQSSKTTYKDPKKAERKRQQARQSSKTTYKDPKKAERNVNRHDNRQKLLIRILKRQKGNVNRHDNRQKLLIRILKRQKGNVNRHDNRQKLLIRILKRQKGNVNRHDNRQKLLIRILKRQKGNVNRHDSRQKLLTRILKRQKETSTGTTIVKNYL